jgi:hypothetical protein
MQNFGFKCITMEADLMCELLKRGADPNDNIIKQSRVIRSLPWALRTSKETRALRTSKETNLMFLLLQWWYVTACATKML